MSMVVIAPIMIHCIFNNKKIKQNGPLKEHTTQYENHFLCTIELQLFSCFLFVGLCFQQAFVSYEIFIKNEYKQHLFYKNSANITTHKCTPTQFS